MRSGYSYLSYLHFTVVAVPFLCITNKAWFLRLSRFQSIAYLITLRLLKKKICFGKSLGKIVNFASVSLNIRTREKQN